MPNVWFTADTHFGHCNILQYCQRPFRDHDHMTEAIVERFNAVLRPGDVLWHLGDIKHSSATFAATLGRLNTKEIHLVLGNHDKRKECEQWGGFRSIQDLRGVTVGQQRFLLCHYALRTWPGRSRSVINLYGHSHGTLPGVGRQMDVGVDTNDFYPYEASEIVRRMEKIAISEGDVE